jgi:hypothetical protein
MCIDVEGGMTVKAVTIEKQWKLSQYRPKPSESGEDTYYEKYLPKKAVIELYISIVVCKQFILFQIHLTPHVIPACEAKHQ